TVYEVSEDPNGNPMFLRIGFNDNFTQGSTAARVTFPVSPSRIKDPPGGPRREYPYYYVVVSDANPQGGFGRCSVVATFPPTDDHPDGDTNADGVFDTGEFPVASQIVIDPVTGLGSSFGNIERTSDTDLFYFTAPA